MTRSGHRGGILYIRLVTALVAGLAMVGGPFLAGCKSSEKPAGSASTSSSLPPVPKVETSPELEASYLIGPTAARDVDARIVWQKRITPTGKSGIKRFDVIEDSLFILDGRNMLTRLRIDSGERLWTLPVGSERDHVQGLIYLPTAERVYVAIADALLVIDSTVGSQLGRQRFERIANTPPVLYGGSIIYGSLNGQLVWHNYAVGTQYRAYQVSNSLSTAPVIEGSTIVTAGADGNVMALSAASASRIWSTRLLDDVVAPPAVGNGAVFIAGLDQSLWAFELGSGRSIWRYRTESPLHEAPTLIGDHVYQYVPDQGLLCFEAVPLDAPAGNVVWRMSEVSGRVILNRRGVLYVWDSNRRELITMSEASGHVMKKVSLPNVRHLLATNVIDGELFAASDDGRVIHVGWKN